MKLPRWLVVSLLSASLLAVLGSGAWWWVTWPVTTALRRRRSPDDRGCRRGEHQPGKRGPHVERFAGCTIGTTNRRSMDGVPVVRLKIGHRNGSDEML